MPQMTGLELQQQLNVRGWRIPVIFITGMALFRWRLQR
jgi:FixJ family two-component response regulator